MDDDFTLIEFDNITHFNDEHIYIENIYDYTDVINYKKCDSCNLNLHKDAIHCCQCGNKWINKNQIFCDKCYKDGIKIITYVRTKVIDITKIFQKYNGEAKIYDIFGNLIFSGNIKNGKYDKSGILFDKNNRTVLFKGDFENNSYYGFGVKFNNNTFISGLFNKNSILINLKEIPLKYDLSVCNLCAHECNETELFPVCGSKKCIECCMSCVKKFFDTIDTSRGAIFKNNALLCPFCRNEIDGRVIEIYKPELKKYIPDIKKLKYQKEIVGLCAECNEHEIKELNAECGEQINREKFVCEKCLEVRHFENVKNCPKCKIKVYRINGCHWMACKCDIAWCWHCLAIFDKKESHAVNCKICGKGN
jgi:hypothetical protein